MYNKNEIKPPDTQAAATQLSELLLELSAKLTTVDPGGFENEIKKDLRIISDFLNFDWLTLCEFSGDNNAFSRIYWYFAPFVSQPLISTIKKDTEFITEKIISGKTMYFPQLPNDLPKNAGRDRYFCMSNGIKTSLALPMENNNAVLGALYFAPLRSENYISDKSIRELYYFARILAGILNRTEPGPPKREYINLDIDKKIGDDIQAVVGESPAFKQVLLKARQVAGTDMPVLLLGETGTGKGVIARVIHGISPRKDRQMVQINCASLSPSLIESELFGHEKGAFTGALARRAGCFERADGSTLFLDEIGELTTELQAKLLRVLQDNEFERVGGNETIKCDVRIIAASNRDLSKDIESGRFRRDLYYRLNIFPIRMPLLSERTMDIPLLIDFFVEKYAKKTGRQFDLSAIPEASITDLTKYSWPGNIRELENLVARAVIASLGKVLNIEIPEPAERPAAADISADSGTPRTLADNERECILEALGDTIWRIEGPNGAAKRLGMNPSTLRLRMKKLGIKRPAH